LFTVNSPFFPAVKNEIEIPVASENRYGSEFEQDEISERAIYRDKLIANDSTGEKIYVSYYKPPRYEERKDSIDIKKEITGGNNKWVLRKTKTSTTSRGVKISEGILSDSNSSRAIWVKTFYQDGVVHTIKAETDSLSKPGSFLSAFFNSFQPIDTAMKKDLGKKPADIFFEDFFGQDSAAHKKAITSINTASFSASDLPQLKKAVQFLNWKDKNYLNAKKNFIDQIGTLKTDEASSYLKEVFYAAGDTVDLQYKTLENLLTQQTKYSFGLFRDIMVNDPPVLNLNLSPVDEDNYSEETFLEGLYDSLELTSSIVSDLLPLINIDDYKQPVIELMARLVDNYLLSFKEYESFVPKFLLEARQALKKQTILEKNRAINKAQKNSTVLGNEGFLLNINEDFSLDYGNETLNQYAILLMPGWKKNAAIANFLQLLLTTNDKQLKYETMLLFIKNERQVPDSLVNEFAADVQYRYQLYKDLNQLGASQLFPGRYKNQLDLARGKLFAFTEYDKPDSVVFLKKQPVQWANADGFIYFFKYRQKKDDDWKLATVGLVPKDSTKFEFDTGTKRDGNDLDFTEYSNERLKENEPLEEQINKRLKRLLYAKRPSAKEFYGVSEDRFDYRAFTK
jgi:hypothetical protein